MATIVESIEISRRPEEVFAYATDFAHFPEWQAGVVSVHREDAAPLVVDADAIVTRRVGPKLMPTREAITELHPPTSWVVRAGGGLLIATARGTIEPLDDGTRSRLTIALEFEGHGIGKLLVPLVLRRQARKQLPSNEHKLKVLLERDG